MRQYVKITNSCSRFPAGLYKVLSETTYCELVTKITDNAQSTRVEQFPGLSVANSVHQLVIPTSAASRLANSIEELCDEFVAIYDDGDFQPIFQVHSKEELFSEILKYGNKLEDFAIYAAIWTSTGLQYVAKLEASTTKFQLCEY